MKVGLFVPCTMDLFAPRAAMATLELLERLDVDVVYPEGQTCCGQPLLNAGEAEACRPVAQRFVEIFAGFDAVVCPSASCAAMVRRHYGELLPDGNADAERVRGSTYELCEFLVDVLGVTETGARFPYKVGLHRSCHGVRDLRLETASELLEEHRSKITPLLHAVRDLELVDLQRPDECCGFGGTFAVTEEAVSCRMGRDRVADHRSAGAEVIVSTDTSCLMQLAGLMSRQGSPLPVMHVAEVLVSEGALP